MSDSRKRFSRHRSARNRLKDERRRSQRGGLTRVRGLMALRQRSAPFVTRRVSRWMALASVGALVLLVMALVVGRRYATQKIDVEQNIRAQLIPALEKQLGQKIEIGKIESDYFSRIVLTDVVVGRDAKSPLGALMQAKRVTISLDAIGLVLRRTDPLQAISQVAIESPQLFLLRDADKRFNISTLLKNKATGESKWRGLVTVRNGRVWYEDHFLKGASGQKLLVDGRGIQGEVRVNGPNPISYALHSPRAFAGNNRVLIRDVDAKGTVAANGKWLTADVVFPQAPAVLLADYAFRKREMTALGGQVGGRANIMWDAALPKDKQTVATGVLSLTNVSGFAVTALEPGTTRPLLVQNINGPLRFTESALETSGINAVLLQTPLRLAGSLTLKPMIFDVRASSNAFNVARLTQTARSFNRTAEFQNTKIGLSSARGEVRVTGEKKSWSANGKLTFPALSAANSRFGAGAARALTTDFFIQNNAQNGAGNNFRASANFTASQADYASPKFGKFQASGNLRGALQWSGTPQRPQWQVRLAAASADASGPQAGTWRASNVTTLIRNDNGRIAAELGATKLAGRHAQLGVLGARNLQATAGGTFPNLSTFSARITAASALGNGAHLAQLRGVTWQSGALRASVTGNGGVSTMQLNASNLRASQSQNAAQMRSARGFVNWNASRGTTIFSTRFDARGANIRSAQAGNWHAASLLGMARGQTRSGATRLQTDVEARDFSGSHTRYGQWSGMAVRLAASTPNAANAPWAGVVALGRTDVSRVNFAALSPDMAARVRDAGVLTGKARFSNLPGKNPTVKGRARLTRITLNQGGQEVALSDVDTQIALGGNQFRLAGLRANSNFGPLQADAQSNLSGGPLRLSLIAPNLILTGAQINPYLAASGVRWQGEARGRVRVTTLAGTKGSSAKAPVYQAQFDFAAPSAGVQYAPKGKTATPLRLAQTRVRGAGTMQFSSARNWRFSGDAMLSSAHFTGAGQENTPSASRAAGLQIALKGTLARNAQGFVPRFQGAARIANLILPLKGDNKIALHNARADFQAQPDLYQVTRFEAFEGTQSKLIGHAALRRAAADRFGLSGQVLAEKMDAARLQELWSNLQNIPQDSPQTPQMNGVLYAQANFTGRYNTGANVARPLTLDEVGLQARLYKGRMVWFNTIVPIDVARLSTTVQYPARGPIPLNHLLVWSGGSRISATGVLTPQNDAQGVPVLALDLDTSVNTLRVRTLRNIKPLRPAFEKAETAGPLDGYLSGQFRITGTSRQPKIEGHTALKVAEAYGIDIEEATANLAFETLAPESTESGSASSFRVALTDIAGRAEGAHFSGSLNADSAANVWNLALQTDDKISTNRLLHLAKLRDGGGGDETPEDYVVEIAGPPSPDATNLSDLPLRGELGAILNLSGSLKAEDGTSRLTAREGTVLLETGTLRWRGRDLGILNADLRLQNGVLQARQFEINHKSRNSEEDAHLRISGVLPVSLDTPDLNAAVTIENEELSFVLEVLEELNRSLSERGQNVAYLNSILKRLKGLPSTVEGRFDMQAQLEQSWRVPVVEVRSLRAREVSFRNANGTQQRLPDVTARFIYDGNDNGAVAIQSAELRLPADAPALSAGDVGSAAAVLADTEGEDAESGSDDLVIRTLRPGRIVPGGEISLAAEILNADLEKLAEWVPALRDASGEAALKGRLSDFVLQFAGTTGAPSVTGSLQGENWEFGQYALDRVRLDRFTIDNGQLQIEPGFLTVVKGDFQSAAAWGSVPWTWGEAGESPGVSLTRPIEIHLPVAKENFGALAGIFVPQVINVGADDFTGEVHIGGTLDEPQLSGQAQITNGAFRLRSARAEMDVGLASLNGTIRFVDGNRLQIEGDGLTGKLVTADEVKAPETGNPPLEKRKENDAKRKQQATLPTWAGDFRLLGNVDFNLSPRVWRSPRRALSAHRYDLKLALAKGSYATATFSGVRDVNLAAVWKTGDGPARTSQELKYVLSAIDNAGGKVKGKGEGQLISAATLQLSPDFAVSADDFFRARAAAFSAGDDFDLAPAAPDATGIPAIANTTVTSTTVSPFVPPVLVNVLREAEGKPSRMLLRDFRFDWENVARGVLGGELTFDNRPADVPDAPPFSTPRARPRFYEGRVQATALRGGNSPTLESIEGDPGEPGVRPSEAREGGDFRIPLRVAGKITLTNAELYGAPAPMEVSDTGEDDGGVTRVAGALSMLPDAPRFEIKLEAGREVQFVSSNLRATIVGELDLGGTPHDPILFGTVTTKSGSITFPNARARLESGEITITARRDPVADVMRTRVEIDATARGRSGRYDFTIQLRGPLDTGEASTQDLRVDISSNPPLSTDEAFAQLLGTAALNRGGADGRSEETYARAIVGILSGPLFSGIERTLERTLGLTSIALDYRIDEPIGIEIGKAVGERLYISYRRALSSPSGQKTPFNLRLEYRVKGDVQIGIETDESEARRFTIERRWRF